MKNIFIIHSLNGDTLEFWGQFDGYHRIYQIPELIDLINKITK